MSASILINRSFGETRVALLEEGVVSEVYVERDREQGLVGNIYKGRVTRVLPGMQAAFVDIGLSRAAFLYADDVRSPDRQSKLPPRGPRDADGEEERHGIEDEKELSADEVSLIEKAKVDAQQQEVRVERPSIASLVREGQEILCQVSKDPLGTKGARITTYISVPGRYTVFMPTTDHVGVSKRITEETERKRLRELVEGMCDGTGGFIVRTEGAGLEADKLKEDMDFLRNLWADIEERSQRATAPALLQADLDLVLRATRDLFTREVESLTIDDPREHQRIKDFLDKFAPPLKERVELYDDATMSLFERHNVEGELERALERKVGMKSGASIVIDQAEALTAIDVNTGGFVGKQNLEATILRTNLEAVKEIVTQLRLRNIGGIIVIDFIDMESAESRERVYAAFLEELKRDRAKTHVLPISGLGVIEMTRKRVRESLGRRLTEACPYCEGRGRIRSRSTVCHEIFREVARQKDREGQVMILANPEVAAMLAEDEADTLAKVETHIGRPVVVEARSDYHHEAYRVLIRS
jgi:ribonuclease G